MHYTKQRNDSLYSRVATTMPSKVKVRRMPLAERQKPRCCKSMLCRDRTIRVCWSMSVTRKLIQPMKAIAMQNLRSKLGQHFLAVKKFAKIKLCKHFFSSSKPLLLLPNTVRIHHVEYYSKGFYLLCEFLSRIGKCNFC